MTPDDIPTKDYPYYDLNLGPYPQRSTMPRNTIRTAFYIIAAELFLAGLIYGGILLHHRGHL
jgi:hypothetical protein